MSIFTGMTKPQLTAALGSAQLALIKLQIGEANVSLSYSQGDGAKSVTKRVATVGEVTTLILQLQQALGIAPRRRTIGFICR